LRNLILKWAKWNCLGLGVLRTTSCVTCHVGSPPYHWVACRSRLATAGPWPASASTVCLRGVTHCPPLGRCHAATAHSPLRVPPSAIDRRPAARRLRAMPTTLWITNLGRRGLVTLLAYKPPPGSFPCTRQ
jgi:hypothetical protein